MARNIASLLMGASGKTTRTTEAKRARRRRQRQKRNMLFKELNRKCGSGAIVEQPDVTTQSGAIYTPDRPAGETQNWVLKALHPNGEEITSVVGIPDHVSVPVVSPEFRQDVVISPNGASDTNDNIDIVSLPFGDLVGIYRRYKATASPGKTTRWIPIWNPTFNDTIAYRSYLIEQSDDATNQRVTFAERITDMNNVYGFGRMTYRGITTHLDAPATQDQGRITGAQLAIPYGVSQAAMYGDGWVGPDQKNSVLAQVSGYSLDGIPLDPACLTQASPGASTWEAREGMYVPVRFRDPAHQFTPSGGVNVLMVTQGPYASALRTDGTVTGPDGTTGSAPALLSPRMLLNGMTTVILYRGISGAANVHLKIRTGMECQVDTCSTISPYQRMSPSLDREAIDTVARLSQDLPQVFTADMNDMGGMINAIVGVTRKIRNKIAGWGIPGISDFMKWQNKNIYEPVGLAPMRMPTVTGWKDPLKRVYDRMTRNRMGYQGLYL